MDATISKRMPQSGIGKILFFTLIALIFGIAIAVSTTDDPGGPKNNCSNSPTFVPSESTEFSNWRIERVPATQGSHLLEEWLYYATYQGTERWIGRVGIILTNVPTEAQATLRQANIYNPNVYVSPPFRGKGIGEYLLRDTVQKYPAGTKFLWQQDPGEASGAYCWSKFLADYSLQSMNVNKSLNFPEGQLRWFVN